MGAQCLDVISNICELKDESCLMIDILCPTKCVRCGGCRAPFKRSEYGRRQEYYSSLVRGFIFAE